MRGETVARTIVVAGVCVAMAILLSAWTALYKAGVAYVQDEAQSVIAQAEQTAGVYDFEAYHYDATQNKQVYDGYKTQLQDAANALKAMD